MKKNQPYRLLTYLILSISSAAIGQTDLWMHSITNTDGLRDEYNKCIYRDSEGFIWINSLSGLYRYDGKKVKPYHAQVGGSGSLLEENILGGFAEDAGKNIWFGTTNAVNRYNRKTDDFSTFAIKSNEKHLGDYRVMALEQDSFLWVSVNEGVWRMNIFNGEFANVFTDSSYLRYFPQVFNDKVLRVIGAYGWNKDGACIYRIKDGQLFDSLHLYKGQVNIYDVKFDGDSIAWMGADAGLLKLNLKSNATDIYDYLPGHQRFLCNCDEEKMVVSINKQGLFYFYKNGRFEQLNARLASPASEKLTPNVFECYIDAAQNLWVNMEEGPRGVFYANLGKNKFSYIPLKEYYGGKDLAVFHELAEDKDGNIWSNSFQNGLIVLNKKGELIEDFTNDSHFLTAYGKTPISDITADDAGRIWLATYNGIKYFDDQKRAFVDIPIKKQAQADPIFINIYQAPGSRAILASHLTKGLYQVVEENGRDSLMGLNGFGASTFYFLFENSKKELLAAINDAQVLIFKIANQTIQPIDTIDVKGFVNGFYEDKENAHLWMATSLGPYRIDMNDYREPVAYLEVFNNLPDRNIKSILPGDDNSLFFATNAGISKYNLKTGGLSNYHLADGIFSENFVQYGGLKLGNGELWFAGANGITIVPKETESRINHLPTTQITNIKINDQEPPALQCKKTGATNFSEIRHLVLEPDENTVSFEFVAIEYSDPAHNQLKYFLKGVDKDTVTLAIGEPGFARYPKLPHGTYSFYLMGSNSDGIWGPAKEQLVVTVLPRWHEILGVRISMALAFLGIVFLVFKRERRKIEEREMLKTRSSENRMAALRSQMNPHFVFNSLQTVNGLIARQDLKGAMQYVNKFARLMRMILENSRSGWISLEKEIELLKLYMGIEAMRFSTPFEYEITIDDDLDTFDALVPSMILQPFVENAIKHGLFHKKEKGLIKISFQHDDGHLKCQVEDNGVGRQKSTEVNKQEGRGHVSRGLQIVDERLDLIRKEFPGDYTVKTTDLFDADQSPAGTRVEIRLPYTPNF